MAQANSVLGPRKTVEDSLAATEESGFKLKKELGRLDIVVFGVGVMIGAGIFVLTGEAAATEAGPAVTLSFALAAIVCVFAALCYAEFAAMVPVAGSAYTFSYATLGQLIAFIIGWDLVLEFTVGSAAVAVGAGGFVNAILDQVFGYSLPDAISAPPGEGGTVNLPAIAVVALVSTLLYRGIRISARFNIVLVAVTVAVLVLVVVVGGTQVDTANWDPFFPFGFDGVVGGAALVFFAFIGFDVVATTAEEARDPQRDMSWGIIGSLVIVTLFYIAVSGVVTGMVPFKELTGDAPVATAFDATLDSPVLNVIIFAGALVALINTVLILMLGQSRVFFAMARDHLLPRGLGRTHESFGTPHRITLITATAVALMSGFIPLTTLAELVNIGTLFAFALVAVGILYLRRADPGRERPFRTPLVPVVPILAIVGCLYLAIDLPGSTWIRFLGWMALGLVVYFAWSRRAATAQARREETS